MIRIVGFFVSIFCLLLVCATFRSFNVFIFWFDQFIVEVCSEFFDRYIVCFSFLVAFFDRVWEFFWKCLSRSLCRVMFLSSVLNVFVFSFHFGASRGVRNLIFLHCLCVYFVLSYRTSEKFEKLSFLKNCPVILRCLKAEISFQDSMYQESRAYVLFTGFEIWIWNLELIVVIFFWIFNFVCEK